MAAASITGVFTILDRASGPMRKMEAQAAKTMAAIEGVGAALDAAGGGSGSNSFARNAEKMARGLQDIDRSGTQASRSLAGMGDAMKKSDKDGKGFLATMQKLRDVAGGLSAVITGLKWSVLATGIGLAVQAVGALSAGVIALIPRLTDLVGVLAAAPAAVGTFAQSMGTLMFALKPAFAAITAGFQKAAKSTDPLEAAMARLGPSGQRFVKQVIALRPAFDSLSRAAGARLFPELSKSLRDVEKLFPMLRRNLTATGGALGQSISGLTGDLTTPQRMSDLNKIMQSQTRLAGYAGQGFRNLANALVDFMVAARPFSEWLGRTLTGWTRYIANAAKAGRETGGIARYLDRTKSSMQLFGNMLKNVWEIMTALGAAARPLGDRLWGGANRALEGWAAFLNSAEGATEARKWFDSMYEPLHAMGQLIKTAAVEIFGMTKNTDSLTSTLNSLQGALPALAEFFTNAASLGPGIGRALTSIAEILNALPWAPTKLLIDGLAGMLEIVNQLVKAFPPLAWALAGYLTFSAGSKMLAAIGMVKSLAMAWREVALAQAGASAGGGGFLGRMGRGGAGKMPGGGIPFMGMVPGGKPTGGGLRGQFRTGGTGAGLAVGLGGGVLASLAGSAIGGDAGNKVSSIGGMAATGAGLGMLAGPWGALAGGLVGAVAGAISVGLFKGADRAKEAGKKAGDDYIKGLGMAGINPATGRPYPRGQNPFAPLADRVDTAKTRIERARENLLKGGVDLEAEGGRAGAGRVGNGLRPKVQALDRAEAAAVPTYVQALTQPRQNRILSNAQGLVDDFDRQFKGLGPMARRRGAEALMQWVEGMDKRKRTAKGYTESVAKLLAKEMGGPGWARSGKEAAEKFAAAAKASKAIDRVRELGNKLTNELLDGRGGPVKINSIEARIKTLRQSLGNVRDRGERSRYRKEIEELEKLARAMDRARRKRDQLDGPPAAGDRKRGFGEIVGRGAYGRGKPGPGLAPSTKPIQATPVKPPATAAVTNAYKRIGSSANDSARKFVAMADRSKTSSTRIKTHASEMATKMKTATNQMIEDTNRVFGAIGASPQITVRAATGARLPAFASGGRIPGAPMGDHIPLYGRGGALLGIADGGELVVNRHTEKRVNGMLAHHGTSLGKEVAGERKPHFALGGRMPGALGSDGDNHIKGRVITGGQEHIIREQGRIANSLLARTMTALNKKIDSIQPRTGLGNFQGFPVSNWIISVLKYAQKQGWGGSVTSGYRSAAKQAAIKANDSRAAAPGASNHNSIDYPGGAVDVGGFEARGAGSALNSKIQGFPGKYKLVWGGPAINDWGHFSATGNAHGGRLPRFGGWHARGMHGMVSKPTLIGVGERGPERVKVTPAGKQSRSRGNIEVHIGNINYSRKGDVAKAIRAEMELLSDELAQMGDNE